MRLTREQRSAILEAVRARDPDAQVVLFGSRADPAARGGDIDLLVLSDRIGFRDLWPVRRDILDRIGWQKLDLIVDRPGAPAKPVSRIALETGLPL